MITAFKDRKFDMSERVFIFKHMQRFYAIGSFM